jgi:hypothetical protein
MADGPISKDWIYYGFWTVAAVLFLLSQWFILAILSAILVAIQEGRRHGHE